jgi:FkbM family methyltransferase
MQKMKLNLMTPINLYRRIRVIIKQILGNEPKIPIQFGIPIEYHGNPYCGWGVPLGTLTKSSVVVDVGLGEDISFSTSIAECYSCAVHGLDPTPRSISYIENLGLAYFTLHKVGLAANSGISTFYLPNNELHVSGSLSKARHTGVRKIDVQLVSIEDMFNRIGCDRINLLKIDIEGAEYDLLMGECFANYAKKIDVLCIEFHHRWSPEGVKDTEKAVTRLKQLGFACIWCNQTTNEEFTFQRT